MIHAETMKSLENLLGKVSDEEIAALATKRSGHCVTVQDVTRYRRSRTHSKRSGGPKPKASAQAYNEALVRFESDLERGFS